MKVTKKATPVKKAAPAKKAAPKRGKAATQMPQHHLDICDRFRLIREMYDGSTQAGFAKKLNVTLSYIKRIEVRDFTPNIYAIKQLSSVFNISYDWILDGTTPIWKNNKKPMQKAPPKIIFP